MVPQLPMDQNQTPNPAKKKKNGPGEMSFPQIDKFPEELHRSVKSRAAQKGRSIKEFVVEALRYALENDHVIREKGAVDSEIAGGRGTDRRPPTDAPRASRNSSRGKSRKQRI